MLPRRFQPPKRLLHLALYETGTVELETVRRKGEDNFRRFQALSCNQKSSSVSKYSLRLTISTPSVPPPHSGAALLLSRGTPEITGTHQRAIGVLYSGFIQTSSALSPRCSTDVKDSPERFFWKPSLCFFYCLVPGKHLISPYWMTNWKCEMPEGSTEFCSEPSRIRWWLNKGAQASSCTLLATSVAGGSYGVGHLLPWELCHFWHLEYGSYGFLTFNAHFCL